MIPFTFQSCVFIKNVTKVKYKEDVYKKFDDNGDLYSKTKDIVYSHRPVHSHSLKIYKTITYFYYKDKIIYVEKCIQKPRRKSEPAKFWIDGE